MSKFDFDAALRETESPIPEGSDLELVLRAISPVQNIKEILVSAPTNPKETPDNLNSKPTMEDYYGG
mgnify:FL=1